MTDPLHPLLSNMAGGTALAASELSACWTGLFEPLDTTDFDMARDSGISDEELQCTPWHLVSPVPVLPGLYGRLMTLRNGGALENGDRVIEFLRAQELREYLVSYGFPWEAPSFVPFAFDGSGTFYCFRYQAETRDPPV